ncbi:MAG: dethiobiotin synthase [Myxococcota bacterium]
MRVKLRLFVTATDTGVGKTEAACALLSLLAEAGERPAPFKPYESGCADLARPPDALALQAAAGSDLPLERVCPHRFTAPLAPGVAARRLGEEPDFEKTLAAFRSFEGRSLVVEGAGGLFVPIDSQRDVIDLIEALRLPVLLVARAGLGTLNHTALSLEALAHRRIEVRAVLLSKSSLTPLPVGEGKGEGPMNTEDPSEADNAVLLEERHRMRVLGPVPFIADAKARRLAFRATLAGLVGVSG